MKALHTFRKYLDFTGITHIWSIFHYFSAEMTPIYHIWSSFGAPKVGGVLEITPNIGVLCDITHISHQIREENLSVILFSERNQRKIPNNSFFVKTFQFSAHLSRRLVTLLNEINGCYFTACHKICGTHLLFNKKEREFSQIFISYGWISIWFLSKKNE